MSGKTKNHESKLNLCKSYKEINKRYSQGVHSVWLICSEACESFKSMSKKVFDNLLCKILLIGYLKLHHCFLIHSRVDLIGLNLQSRPQEQQAVKYLDFAATQYFAYFMRVIG